MPITFQRAVYFSPFETNIGRYILYVSNTDIGVASKTQL